MKRNPMESKARMALVDEILKALDEGTIPWEKPWKAVRNHNIASGREYTGVNQLMLMITAFRRDYTDSRWITASELKKRGISFKGIKSSASVIFYNIDYYNDELKKRMSAEDYDKLPDSEKEGWRMRTFERTTAVWNCGLFPELAKSHESRIENADASEIHEMLAAYMKSARIHLTEGTAGQNRAFYIPGEDAIVLPAMEQFRSVHDYVATMAHEVAHSTGDRGRLERSIANAKGSNEYAYEELVAELGSTFICSKGGITVPDEVMENHKAYIGSWSAQIRDKPELLFDAIREAQMAADFVEYPDMRSQLMKRSKTAVQTRMKHFDEMNREREAQKERSTTRG